MARKFKKNRALSRFIKLALGIFVIYLVFTRIDLQEVMQLISSANISLVALAVIFTFIAQCFGGLRMHYYLRKSGMLFSKLYAVSFYFIGTMLNTVVPGGIGGDGYKAYYFWRKYRFPWTKTVLTVVRGRFSAMFFLLLSLIIVSLLYVENINISNIEFILFSVLIILFPLYAYMAKKFLNEDLKTVVGALYFSGMAHTFYILATISILKSFGNIGDILGYVLVFQIANIVAVIPISIGGIGIREYTYILVAEYIGLDVGIGVAASLIFYAVYSLTSLFGAVPYFFLDKLDKMQKKEMEKFSPNRLF